MMGTQQEHELKLAKIRARAAAFQKSPFWFTVWYGSQMVFNIVFWLAFWSLVTQCSCKCIW